MSIVRGMVLVAGVVLIGAAGLGALQSQNAPARANEVSLKMPVAETAVRTGRYSEPKWHGFPIAQPETYKFTPSDLTRKLAARHVDDKAPGSPVWYEYVPDAATTLPLVILLHGAGRDGLSLIEMWSDTAKKHQIALLAPDAPGGKWPHKRPDPDALQHLIDRISVRHDIDPERVYLFGHSNGAAYAQVLLNRTTGPWRTAVLHAGFVPTDMLVQPTMPKPFRLYIGEHEHVFSVEDAKRNGRELAGRGHDNDLVIIPGHTHWLYEAGPLIAERSWNWLVGIAP